MKTRCVLAAPAVLCAASLALAAGTAKPPAGASTPLADFRAANPAAQLYHSAGRIDTVYGPAFSFGSSTKASAEAFLRDHADIFGVDPANLLPTAHDGPSGHERNVSYRKETDSYKFTLYTYTQHQDGVPVYDARLKLLVRNEAGAPLVLARSSLKPMNGFRVSKLVQASPAEANARAAIIADEPLFGANPNLVTFSQPTQVIWAGEVEDANVAPTLALQYTVETGSRRNPDTYARYTYLADAATGAVLHRVSLITHVDVTGNVSGLVTDNHRMESCDNEITLPMQYARVNIGATVAYADVNGNFTIPNAGSSPVTVTSEMRGRWFRVDNVVGAEDNLSLNVTPPGPANFVHNSANSSALVRAQTNTYYESNVIRDRVLGFNPTYPTIFNQAEFLINANIASTCNAFYDGVSINFYQAGGGCANTAYGDVVHHEYGHHLVQVGGSGQGSYGEGMGDVMGLMITDVSILGRGFQLNCNAGIRNANNTKQYDGTPECSGEEIHGCGTLISGCVWSTRDELVITNPSNYWDILGDLCVNSILLHNGSSITPTITIDFLTLDDDNADITDGTPHYSEIATGFGEHNMDAPPLQLLSFAYSPSRPALINPTGQTEFTVTVNGIGANSPQPNTGILYVDPENDGSYVQYPMTQASANVYNATFPATPCGSNVRYYVSARTTTNTLVTNPSDAPASYYSAISGYALTNSFNDNFQTNKGWTTGGTATDGQWGRGVPINCGRGDPDADYDGSGQCYLTDNDAANGCNSDVDGGTVVLTSPTMNATGGEAYISYARWLDNTFGDNPNTDTLVAEISNNNGTSYVNLETVGPAGSEVSGGWYHKTFKVSSKITPSATMKVRFTTSDNSTTPSVVEAGIDAVSLDVVDCEPPCPADWNGDGSIDAFDYDDFVNDYFNFVNNGVGSADYNNDGYTDAFDYDDFVNDFFTPCP